MKKEKKKITESIKSLVDDIIHERIKVPDNALIIDFDTKLNIFTPKRIELVNAIINNKPETIQEIADYTKRTKQAVDRDLQLLEQVGIIELKKSGRITKPILKQRIVIVNLISNNYINESNNKLMVHDKKAKYSTQL